MNVTLQPQDWLDRSLASTSSEHAQSIPTSPIPLNMDNDKMMTWDAFLSHYSPVHDLVNWAPARSYETIPDNQQDLALTSTIMYGNSGSFLVLRVGRASVAIRRFVYHSWYEPAGERPQVGRNQLERFSWTGAGYSHETGTRPKRIFLCL
jgi:hypothetical protein